MQMVNDIRENVKNPLEEGALADYLTKILQGRAGDCTGLIYGMGHAVYTISDPRAIILKENAVRLAENTEYEADFELLDKIEKLTPELVLKVRGTFKPMCANVDLYSGFVYKMLRIPEDLFTPIFAVSRMAGWSAHRIEELFTGGRIIRPALSLIHISHQFRRLEAGRPWPPYPIPAS